MEMVTITINNGHFDSEHIMKKTTYEEIIEEFGSISDWLKTLLSSDFTIRISNWFKNEVDK